MTYEPTVKKRLIARVRRMSGQVSAIERAITEGAGCTALLHQAAAVRGSVARLIDQLVEAHLREKVAHPDLRDVERAEGAGELIEAMRRYVR